MRKLWLTILLSTLVTFTCACGTNKQEAKVVEETSSISEEEEEDVAESAVSEESEEPEEEEEEAVEESEANYTGFYAYYPDDMNKTCHEVNITSHKGYLITFVYNFYNTRSANGTEELTVPLNDNKVKFAAPIYGGHGADGQISNLQFEFLDENTLIVRNLDSEDEWTLVKQGEAKDSAEYTTATENEQNASSGENAGSSAEVYPEGYAPSKSGAFATNDIIGEYTSDNGNVYSVNMYTSGDDERVGIIYLNRDEFGGNPEEKPEIIRGEQANVYPVYEGNGVFVFDHNGSNYMLSYYKDGSLWDRAVMTRKYQPS